MCAGGKEMTKEQAVALAEVVEARKHVARIFSRIVSLEKELRTSAPAGQLLLFRRREVLGQCQDTVSAFGVEGPVKSE